MEIQVLGSSLSVDIGQSREARSRFELMGALTY
jgi:hypothetical protein